MIDETASSNSLICDPATGICGLPNEGETLQSEAQETNKPVKAIYFSDPVCSACWGLEPVLGKLKLEYGDTLDIEYRMGGLLPNWEAMGSITPARIATHVEEMGRHFEMPMNGKVWAQDPPHSSFPPSIAFKAAQMQDATKALRFLRRLREMLFVEATNIAQWENIVAAATDCGLDTAQLQRDYESKAGELFDEDMELARQLGVKGFPTLIFSNALGKRETLQGAKPYAAFEQAIANVYPAANKQAYPADWQPIFARQATLATKEFAVIGNISMADANRQLETLAKEGKITKQSTTAGDIWRVTA